MNMKKMLIFLLTFALLTALAGCGGGIPGWTHPRLFRIDSKSYAIGQVTPDDLEDALSKAIRQEEYFDYETAEDGCISSFETNSEGVFGYKNVHVGISLQDAFSRLGDPTSDGGYTKGWYYNSKGELLSEEYFHSYGYWEKELIELELDYEFDIDSLKGYGDAVCMRLKYYNLEELRAQEQNEP